MAGEASRHAPELPTTGAKTDYYRSDQPYEALQGSGLSLVWD